MIKNSCDIHLNETVQKFNFISEKPNYWKLNFQIILNFKTKLNF